MASGARAWSFGKVSCAYGSLCWMPRSATSAAHADGSVTTGKARNGRTGDAVGSGPVICLSSLSSTTGVDRKPERGGRERRRGAGGEHDGPAVPRGERGDDRRRDDAAEIAAGVEESGRRHRVGRRETHRGAPEGSLGDLDAAETETERRDRAVRALDAHRQVEEERGARQRRERHDAHPDPVAEAAPEAIREAAPGRRRGARDDERQAREPAALERRQVPVLHEEE